MQVVLDKAPSKYLAKMNEPMRGKMIEALKGLAKEPPEGDIKKLQGNDSYRVRVGGYRIVYYIKGDKITVSRIAPRGQVYRGIK
ncbi:plasmid stabilization system protein [Campylobacterota bacterium]|nr:plasmid stabilization system protein [Campylobacterota bacterium]